MINEKRRNNNKSGKKTIATTTKTSSRIREDKKIEHVREAGQGRPPCWSSGSTATSGHSGHSSALPPLGPSHQKCCRWRERGQAPDSSAPSPGAPQPGLTSTPPMAENMTKTTSSGRRPPSLCPAPRVCQVSFSNVSRHR